MTGPSFLSELERRNVWRDPHLAPFCRKVGLPTPEEVAAEAAKDKPKA